jgi:anti-sigma regulatory factor (Ser/Thr protein kinase)
VSESLPPEARSAGVARHLVLRALAEVRPTCQEVTDTAALLVTELVTNALVHARSALRLDVTVCDDTVRVAVADRSPVPPVPLEPRPHATGGRGLFLVEELSSSWGSEPVDDGKVVWFELELTDA